MLCMVVIVVCMFVCDSLLTIVVIICFLYLITEMSMDFKSSSNTNFRELRVF